MAACSSGYFVMPGLVPGIHALLAKKEGVDGRAFARRSRFDPDLF
jgi:hypothetical protein